MDNHAKIMLDIMRRCQLNWRMHTQIFAQKVKVALKPALIAGIVNDVVSFTNKALHIGSFHQWSRERLSINVKGYDL